MAALSEDVLKKLISPNAKALSKPGGVEKIMEDRDPEEYNDFDDSMFLAETYGEPTIDYSSNNFNPERVKKSKLLSTIKEEMIAHPIDTTALNSQMIESAGGGNPLNNDRLSQMVARAKQVDARASELDGKGMPRKRLTETVNSGGGGIDYSLIKTIVNECIETKLNEVLSRGLLTEGATLSGIGLKNGKIKIVDNKGNVYSAKLEYQGNTKDKK